MPEKHTVFGEGGAFRGLFVATTAVSSAAAVMFLSYKVLDYKRKLESRMVEVELATQNFQPEVSNLNAMYSEMIDKKLDKVKRDYGKAIESMMTLKASIQKNFITNVKFLNERLKDETPVSRSRSASELSYLA